MYKNNSLYRTQSRLFLFLTDTVNINLPEQTLRENFTSINFNNSNDKEGTALYSENWNCDIKRLDFDEIVMILEHRELKNLARPKIIARLLTNSGVGWVYFSPLNTYLSELELENKT